MKKKRKKQEYKTRKKIVVRMQACVLFTLYLLSIAMLRIKIESPNAVYHRYALNIQRLKKKKEKKIPKIRAWMFDEALIACFHPACVEKLARKGNSDHGGLRFLVVRAK